MDNDLASNPSHAARQQRSWRMETHLRKLAHKARCHALPPMRAGEADQLMAAFIAARGVTQCPPAYVAASQ
jgi:hypothetical protein